MGSLTNGYLVMNPDGVKFCFSCSRTDGDGRELVLLCCSIFGRSEFTRIASGDDGPIGGL